MAHFLLELKPGELHDHYMLAPCWVNGTIRLKDGRTYTWEIRSGNTLQTTFPNGRDKMLSGKYLDDLSQ